MFGTFAQATFVLVIFVKILLYTNIFTTRGAILYIQLCWKFGKFSLQDGRELKFFGGLQNLFGTQNFLGPKVFSDTFLDVKFCGQILLRTNNFDPNFLGQDENFLGQNFFCTRYFFPKYFYGQKTKWTQKIWEHKIIWTHILFGYEFFWHKIVLKMFLELRFLMKLKFFYQNICLNAFLTQIFLLSNFFKPKFFHPNFFGTQYRI